MNRLDLDVTDPTTGIPTIPQGRRSRALSDPEIGRLLRWLDSGVVSRTIADVLRLTLFTGARSGEVCAMRTRDVDVARKVWTHTGQDRRRQRYAIVCACPCNSAHASGGGVRLSGA